MVFCNLYCHYLCVLCLVILSNPTLHDPMDCNLPGFCVHGILQVRILGRLPFSTPGDLPDPGIQPTFLVSPAWQAGFLPLCHLRSPGII